MNHARGLLGVACIWIVVACQSERQTASVTSSVQRAKLAGHALNSDFGPIWPHDSACFVQVEKGRSPGDEQDAQGNDRAEEFSHCVDSLECIARHSPLTAQRRATFRAREAMGLPAEPTLSSETVGGNRRC